MLDLGTSFVASVDRDPHAVAIVDGDLRLTYRDWYRAICSVVAGLDAAGLRPGDHLVTLLQNRWEAATLHWACQLAGVIITPINWRAKPEELDFVVENATARAVAFETVSVEAVAGSAACQGLPRIAIGLPPGTEGVAFADLLAQEAPPATPRANAEAWSLMLYTSGTTGKPKGVPRRHRAERAAAVAHVAQNLYSHGECTLGVMPLYHTMGVRSLLAMSLIGGCFVCLPRFDCLGALALIERERVTNLYLVPTLYHDIAYARRGLQGETTQASSCGNATRRVRIARLGISPRRPLFTYRPIARIYAAVERVLFRMALRRIPPDLSLVARFTARGRSNRQAAGCIFGSSWCLRIMACGSRGGFHAGDA